MSYLSYLSNLSYFFYTTYLLVSLVLLTLQESAIHTMHAEIDDMLHQAKNSEEKAKKAMIDAARLADELRSEQVRN